MKIYKNSPDGNAHVIMGVVRKLLIEVGRQDEWPLARARMMSGNYENLCAVANEVSFGSIEVVDGEHM